jgi:hypothetical protein
VLTLLAILNNPKQHVDVQHQQITGRTIIEKEIPPNQYHILFSIKTVKADTNPAVNSSNDGIIKAHTAVAAI